MKRAYGFTVIELMAAIVLAGVVAALFFTQKFELDATIRDSNRKTAINAMYYNLEEVYYAKNGYYPEKIDSKTLRAMDPELFVDPSGIKLGDPNTQYHYEPLGCSEAKCTSYSLRTFMEKEAEYVKKSRN